MKAFQFHDWKEIVTYVSGTDRLRVVAPRATYNIDPHGRVSAKDDTPLGPTVVKKHHRELCSVLLGACQAGMSTSHQGCHTYICSFSAERGLRRVTCLVLLELKFEPLLDPWLLSN